MGKRINNAFFAVTRKATEKEYKKWMERYKKENPGKEPDYRTKKSVRHHIAEKKAKRLRGRVYALAAAGFIGIGAFALKENLNDTKALGSGETVETVELEPEENNATSFEESLKFDEAEYEQEIYDSIVDEINALETKDEVLNYVKEIYAEAYNKENGTSITAEDMQLSKKMNGLSFKYDTAENGDNIVRLCGSDESIAKKYQGLVAEVGVTIQDGEQTTTEKYLSSSSGTIRKIYGENEEVLENEELSEQMNLAITALTEGIDLAYIAGDSTENKEEYVSDLANTIKEYRESKEKEVTNQNEMENDFEIGE